MSKKFGKFLLFSAVAGAAAYGTYYFLKKDNTASPEKAEDMDDDFDDFSEDLDEDTTAAKERSYVSLNLDKAEAFATEAFHKAKEKIVDSVQQVKDTVKAVKETQATPESNFTDLTALNKEGDGAASSENSSRENASAQNTSGENTSAESSSDTDKESAAKVAGASAQETRSSAEDAAKTETADEKVEEFFDDDPLE